jgi:hypothetical protein
MGNVKLVKLKMNWLNVLCKIVCFCDGGITRVDHVSLVDDFFFLEVHVSLIESSQLLLASSKQPIQNLVPQKNLNSTYELSLIFLILTKLIVILNLYRQYF